jgi:hypothetical protein
MRARSAKRSSIEAFDGELNIATSKTQEQAAANVNLGPRRSLNRIAVWHGS